MYKTLIAFSIFCSLPAYAAKTSTQVMDSSKLVWTEAAPGVSIAPAQGDPNKGASHFFLKYASGLKTPNHYHSPDHYVTLIKGTMLLTVNGVEHKLTPGAFFALTNKAPHMAVCEAGADCLMSIDSRGKWDVVLEKK